ncbi:MAG: hypothetical protein CMM28_07405 [Rhodospirillaceae bacterium]|nr:hypothetical protein [Rhodospirillaceae bacterium]
MCGRYSITSPVDAINKLFQTESGINLGPSYNVAPTHLVPSVRADGNKRILKNVRWGLIPSWAKEASIGSRMINARAETVTEKTAFRSAFRNRRCILPANSFYEWTRGEGDTKQPWRIRLALEDLFGFAAIWESWPDPEGTTVESCSILTTTAAADIRPIHHRMPVILSPDEFEIWLRSPANDARALLNSHPGPFAIHTVSKRVNKVANNDASLLMEVEPIPVTKQLGLF